MRRFFYIVFFLAVCSAAIAQKPSQSNEQLAAYYYNKGEYAQAIELYESLYDKTQNKYYYQMLLTCYLNTSQFKEAERLVERRMHKNSRDLYLYVDLGSVYAKRGDDKKAEKEYAKAIEKITTDMHSIDELAEAFENAGRNDMVVACYTRYREVAKNPFSYVSELAAAYCRMGRYDLMCGEYLDLLDRSPGSMNYVQVSLGRSLQQSSGDELSDGIRASLMQRIERQPNSKVYLEMMIWYSLQVKDFEFAMQQAMAVDARFPEQGGEQLYKVAGIALSNADYDVALQSYQAIVDKGREAQHYFDSRQGVLKVQFARLSRNFPLPKGQLATLCQQYEQTIAEIGKGGNTVSLMRDYANVLAYYADSVQRAADILYDIIDMPRLPEKTKSDVKLELGDLLLFAGEVWDASLLYMQVEKAYKEDVLGAKAKYKNAMLSYYNHDFAWAKSQLEVLRSSTSKLVANDAMQLSLLIADNMDPDDENDVQLMEYYATADLMLYRNMLDSASVMLDAIEQHTLSHPLLDEVLMQKAKICMRRERYADADSLLAKLVSFYPDDLLADDALMLRAELAEERLGNKELARECYEKILLDYPASLYVDRARKKYNEK